MKLITQADLVVLECSGTYHRADVYRCDLANRNAMTCTVDSPTECNGAKTMRVRTKKPHVVDESPRTWGFGPLG